MPLAPPVTIMVLPANVLSSCSSIGCKVVIFPVFGAEKKCDGACDIFKSWEIRIHRCRMSIFFFSYLQILSVMAFETDAGVDLIDYLIWCVKPARLS